MKTYRNFTLKLENVDEEKYDMLIEFLEDHKINFEETESEEYTIDERSEDAKYDDWLWTLADNIYEDRKLGMN